MSTLFILGFHLLDYGTVLKPRTWVENPRENGEMGNGRN